MTPIIQQQPSGEQQMTQNYIAILEKTNQQLGLWSNPYGIMIGTLAILFAIAAIGVTIYLWRNSKEQKKERKEQTDAFFSNLEKLVNKNIEEARKQYDNLISEQEKTLASSAKNKTELEKVLNELKKERASIGTNISSSLGVANWGITGTSNSITGRSYIMPTETGTFSFTGNPLTMSPRKACPNPNCNCIFEGGQKFCAACGTKL